MNWISTSIRNKLLMLTGSGTLLVLTAASFAFWALWGSVNTFDRLFMQDIEKERAIRALQVDFEHQVQDWKNVLLRGHEDQSREKYWNSFEQMQTKISEDAATLLERLKDGELKEQISEFAEAHRRAGVTYGKALQLFKTSGFDYKVADNAARGVDDRPTAVLNEAAQRLSARIAEQAHATVDHAHRNMVLSLWLTAGACVLAFVFFVWYVRRGILTPAGRLVEDLDRLASGDFSVPVSCLTEDEFGKVACSAKQVQQQLGGIIHNVRNSISLLTQTSQQLAAFAGEANYGVRQQHSETDQVATAMNEMTATVQEVARNASAAAEAAGQANQEAVQGRKIVGQTIQTINNLAREVENTAQVIERLRDDSDNIGVVLDVIRNIAEQTNLLALNAAIEAARAGEQGRGFAVVADEVRTLAQRTQESTQEIHTMIERLQNGTEQAVAAMAQGRAQTESSVEQAAKAGQSLEAITKAVATITDINVQIASAAEEQSAVAEEINRSVMNISAVAEQTVEGVQKTSTASDQLISMAEELQNQTAQFSV
jgi:methyl-accepting chemotaxis protein